MLQRNKSAHPSRQEISKTLTLIENRNEKIRKILASSYSEDSFRRSVCFTGPAGVGKSSLIAAMAPQFAHCKSLAWLACDPSSPKTGGSLLGDRIRMSGKDMSLNLFIRSLSTRSPSAFSLAIRDMEVYLENYFDNVWVETAGSGQTQTDVAHISGITVLILQPETGDDVQWMKAGVRELADLFIVHKSDLPGADLLLSSLVENGAPSSRILLASSQNSRGIEKAVEMISHLQEKMNWKKRREILQLRHAQALFYETELKKLEIRFLKMASKRMRNPYV